MRNTDKGFSLVELIVVIAIMAVLVGILAPAYLKYVEKSRKSKDVTMLDEVVRAAEAVAAEEEYHVPNNVIFYIDYSNSKLELDILNWNDGNNLDPGDWQHYLTLSETDWREICNNNNNDYVFNSKDWKNRTGNSSFCGIVNPAGVVTWYTSDIVGVFDDVFTYSKNFRGIFTDDVTVPADRKTTLVPGDCLGDKSL